MVLRFTYILLPHSNKTFHMKLGVSIKKIRTIRRLTQKQLSKKSGISVTEIWYIENEKRNPHYSTISCLAQALEVDICFIYLMAINPLEMKETDAEIFNYTLPDWNSRVAHIIRSIKLVSLNPSYDYRRL